MNSANTSNPQYHEFNLKDLLPQSWINNNQKIWLRSYLSLGLQKKDFPTGPKVLDLEDTIAVLLYGQVPFASMQLSIESSETPSFIYTYSNSKTPKGGHLLLFTPLKKNNKNTVEIIEEKAGFLTLFWGHNILYKHLYDNILDLSKATLSGISPVFMNPATFPKPIISEEALECINEAYTNFSQLESKIRSRIKLSLAWFHQSFHTLGLDLFLKRWFAIEALAMSEKENIRPLNTILASVYGTSLSETKKRFGLGKIFGFRSAIVHRGEMHSIHSLLTDYLEAIYCDIIFQITQLPPQFKCQKIIEKENFDLDFLLKYKD